MNFYKNTEQISELVDYEFKLPKYPKSTTDPTYYEPTATRIANMRKSASSGKSLYDFENGYNPDISKVSTMFGRKPYMTQEEVAHQAIQNKLRIEKEIENYDNNEIEKQESIEQIKKINKAVKADKSADATGSNVSE